MDNEGQLRICRAMLDPGSQSNIITKNLSRKLKLRSNKVAVPISGISQSQVTAKESVDIHIKSMHSEFAAKLNCLIVPIITEKLPQVRVNAYDWNIPKDLKLADPDFYLPTEVDILIESSIFWKIICPRQRELNKTLPRLQETLLGWIVGGELISQRLPTIKEFATSLL
jgi:hypothetical protein